MVSVDGTMIERVAMAIYAKNAAAALGRQPWAKAQEVTKESFRDLARAALEEMREPTYAMVIAACRYSDSEEFGLEAKVDENEVGTVWADMIDAALKEDADAA